MTLYRIDYVTKSGERGTWDYEREFPNLQAVRSVIPETLKYARSRMPEIKTLVIVEVTERDVT